MDKIKKTRKGKLILEQASIDSFRIYIPLLLIGKENINPAVFDNSITYNDGTAEITETKKAKLEIGCIGFTVYAHIRLKHSNNFTEQQLIILLNSKYLESDRYFEGITKDTFPIIFKSLIDKGLITNKVDYNSFISSAYVTDMDIKQDFIIPFDEWNMIREATRQFKRPDGIYANSMFGDKKGNKKNKGFQFNTRDKSTPSKPYLKGYNKEDELKTNSKDFTDAYLKGIDLTDLRRIEVQVKDKKHFQTLGFNDNSLKAVLDLTPKQLHSIQVQIFGKYKPTAFKDKIKPKKRRKEVLSPINQFMYDTILRTMIEQENSFTEATETLLNVTNLQDRKAKYQLKQTLKKLGSYYSKNGFNLLSENYSYASKTKIFEHYGLI